MGKLAIKGHATRGKEVIELLEMLGGVNEKKLMGCCEDKCYWFGTNERMIVAVYPLTDWTVFTLEEFLEKFQYKVGDKVLVKDYESPVKILEMIWNGSEIEYRINNEDNWMTADELIPYKEELIVPKFKVGDKVKSKHNKYTYEISQVSDTHYTIIDIEYKCKYTEPISEDENWKLFQEETMEDVYYDGEINCYHQDFGDKVRIRLGGDFEIKVEDGKTYIVKKKPQYPKTYEECCEILNVECDFLIDIDVDEVFTHLIRLKRCRDAYLKIAGEQMGLGKPWKNSGRKVYVIGIGIDGEVTKDFFERPLFKYVFSFPTAEMCDAFFENFKDLIESCNELL